MDTAGESGLDTLAGDVVAILVPPDGPYGVNLRPDETGNAAVVLSFDKLPNGKFGPIQKHGGVHYGDVLFEINDTPLSGMSHNDVIKLVTNRNTLKKIFKFQNPKEYYRRKYVLKCAWDHTITQYKFTFHRSSTFWIVFSRNTVSYKATPIDGKNSFLSAVKKSRISGENTSKRYTEYEIACQYRLVGQKVSTEVVYQWSVWKRYSEFEVLHAVIKKALGWQMDGIELPSAHTFVMNKFAPEFVEQRRYNNNISDCFHPIWFLFDLINLTY